MTLTRALGIFGMIGGLAYAIAGIRMLVGATGEDFLTDLLGVIWAACSIGSAWALLRLEVTGRSLIGRSWPVVLLVGFAGAVAWGLYRLVDPIAADRSPLALAPMVVILGMIGTGALTLRYRRWPLWRRMIPLAIALVYVGTVALAASTGAFTLPYAFALAGIGYVILGDCIRSAPVATTS